LPPRKGRKRGGEGAGRDRSAVKRSPAAQDPRHAGRCAAVGAVREALGSLPAPFQLPDQASGGTAARFDPSGLTRLAARTRAVEAGSPPRLPCTGGPRPPAPGMGATSAGGQRAGRGAQKLLGLQRGPCTPQTCGMQGGRP